MLLWLLFGSELQSTEHRKKSVFQVGYCVFELGEVGSNTRKAVDSAEQKFDFKVCHI
jgi:hypothetical protein